MIDLIERLKHGAIVAGQAAVDEGTSTLAADLMIEAASALAATQAERDAAIEKADKLRDVLEGSNKNRARLIAERDALREELVIARANHIDANTRNMQALDKRDAAEAALTEARRVLREVQWTADNGYDADDACPLCQQPHSRGHAADCALAAVLAQEEKS